MRAYDIRSPNQCVWYNFIQYCLDESTSFQLYDSNVYQVVIEDIINYSVTNTNIALSSGTDTLQFNLSNTSQPFDV